MISSRGPNHVLVVDRTCVPVFEICDAIIHEPELDVIIQKYQVSVDEVFECIEVFADLAGPSKNDFIELVKVDPADDDADIDIETAAVSDWVFLTLVHFGKDETTSTQNFRYLFAFGLRAVILDCVKEIYSGYDDFKQSEIHNICYQAFIDTYGEITKEDAANLLEIIDSDDENN